MKCGGRILSTLILAGIMIWGCSGQESKQKQFRTVDSVELNRYAGVWYEVARKPFRMESGMRDITATYTIRPDGKIKVLNQGYRDGKKKSASGLAWVPDSSKPGQLKVSFFMPFRSDYLIVDLDTVDYHYAIVVAGEGKYAWILTRSSHPGEEVLLELVAKAAKAGIDTSDFIYPEHSR
jgi:lipocalin